MYVGLRWERQKKRDHYEDRRWEDNIKMDLKEIGCGGMDWTQAQDRAQWRALVNTVMNLRVP
jgi:hypothetical protein